MTIGHLVSFLAACTILAAVPGPGMLYVLTRTATGGRAAGLQSTAGTAVGGSVHVMAAALGISAILAASAQAYTVVRWAGAAYLIFLGIRTLLEKPSSNESSPNGPKHSFAQGITTEILNPKTAVFFLAFIPPFVPAGSAASTFLWFVVLGSVSVALNSTADVIAVLTATSLSKSAVARPSFAKWRRRSSGITLVGMGLLAASHDVRR